MPPMKQEAHEDAPMPQAKSANRIITEFMTAALPLENYIREGLPLTPVQQEMIESTLMGFESFLMIWKRKNNIPIGQSPFLSFGPNKRDKP